MYTLEAVSNPVCMGIATKIFSMDKSQLVCFNIIVLFYYIVSVNSVKEHNFLREIEPNHKLIQRSNQPEDKCLPKLELLNCGARTSDMPRVSPYKSTIILSNVDVDTSSCKDIEKVSMQWEVWLVTSQTKYNGNVKILDFFDQQNYFVKQGSLYYGVYEVKVLSNVFFSNKILSANASCYFEMVRLPVQIVIVGGSKRHKFFKNPISFDVLTLVVPDVLESKRGTGQIPPLNIIYEWECDGGDYFCRPLKTTEAFRDIFGPFRQFKEYNFSLKVQTNEKHNGYTKALSQKTEYQAITMDSVSELELSIVCMFNCGGSVFKSNPQDIIHIEAKLNKYFEEDNKSIIYLWNYTIVGSDEKTEELAEIKEKGTAKHIFVVKKNKLIENKKYIFSVRLENVSYAELVVETCSLPKSPNCTIFPDAGVKGETYFNINCSVPKQGEELLTHTFEFFDRNMNESVGRYLGVSTTGVLTRVILTRDRLFVRAVNIFGTYFETVINLQLSPYVQKKSDLNLGNGNLLGNYIYRIGSITAYGDYLNSQVFSPNLTNLLFTMLKKEEKYIEEISGATLLINALHNIMCNVSNKAQYYLDSKTTRKIGKIMHHVSQIAKNTMTDPFMSSRYATTTRVLEICNYIINCSSELLGSVSTDCYDCLDGNIHNDLKFAAFYVMESLKNSLTAVAFKVLTSFEQINFDSTFIEVILIYIGPKMENIAHISEMFKISLNLNKKWLKTLPEFYIQTIHFKKRPFWWTSRSGGEINTNIIDFKLKHGADYAVYETNEALKIDLHVVDFEPLLIYGSVKQPNPNDSPEVNDFIVAVHRIAPAVNSKSFFKFVGIKSNTTLRAILLQGQRPDFDYMNLSATILTNKSSRLDLTMTESNNDLFMYLGILPGEGVKIGEIVNYTFELYTGSCKVRRYETWMMGPKCNATIETNKQQVSCVCSMFNLTLGGQIYVPPNDLNPFSDIPLLISGSDYPFTIILIVIVLILFVFLLLWTNRQDKRNRKRVNLIVLEDNDSRDTCGYLVGVFTGSRIRAGTSSNVRIMLLGEEGMSRSHTLKSELRPTLQSNCDDWFLLYTRHHLGSLTNIIIWMDYSSSRPDWYCSKIFVCDLQKYETDMFYVEKWFGINIQDIHLKMVKECATYKEINRVSRIISENIEYGFRETHLWLSLFIRHPRSLVSSSHRLAVAFSSLFVTICVSTIIYFLTSSQMEDFGHYTISVETFIYGIVSSLVGSSISLITLHFFKASYKLVPCPTDVPYHEHLDGVTNTMYHLERQTSIQVADPSWLQKIKTIVYYIKPCRVIPVQRTEDNLVGIKINRRKTVFAILLCIIISILSIHLTVKYGIHFGEIKSSLWFTSLVIGMIQTVCVTLPIKVLVTTLMFVVSKTRYFPLMSHVLGINQTTVGGLTRKSNEEFCEHLTSRNTLLKSQRSQHAYGQLEQEKRQTRITVIWTSWYTFECLLFLTILCWLILMFNLHKYCTINITVCREVDTQKSCQFSHHPKLDNYNEFLVKIQKQFLPVIYSKDWYNGASKTLTTESFPSSGWLGNIHSRLVGPPRLRQIRVKTVDYCNTPDLMIDNSSHCFVQLNDDTEDTESYNTGWVVDNWIDCQFDQTAWHFTDAQQAQGAPIRIPSGLICHGGGYILSLGGTEDDAKLVIRNIIDTNWIDSYTRVLILEFTTYNANEDIFTSFAFFGEATPFGNVITNQIVQSVKLSYRPVSGMVFLVYFILFFLRVILLINIMGIGHFLKNLWNIQELLILISYLVSVIYYSHVLLLKAKYTEDIQKQGKDVYFQVQMLTSEIAGMKDTVSVLFCLVAFRMLRIIRFNADVRQYLTDLHSAVQGIVWMWLVLSLFIFVQWRLIMFLVVQPPGDSYKDILFYQSDFKIVIYRFTDTQGKILAFMISLLSQIGMFSYVCSLTHYYRKGQLKRNPPQEVGDANKEKYSRYSRLWDSSYD